MVNQVSGGTETFPVRVAGIDIGSNGIRFLAAEFLSLRRFKILESRRAPLRLGHDAFTVGRLRPKTMALTLAAVRTFVKRCRKLGVAQCRVIATSAVRESRNQDLLAAEVRRATGLELEVISGAEEARLVYLAVKRRLRLGRRKWLVANVGGGSVEVFAADSRGLAWNESHTFGAVRLLEEFRDATHRPGEMRKLLGHYLEAFRLSRRLSSGRLAGCIATGGNIEALAKLAEKARPGRDPLALSLKDLRKIIADLAAVPVGLRRRRFELKPGRADVILPAALVYEQVCRLAGCRRLLIPGVGTKEGLVLDLAERAGSSRSYALRQIERVRAACLALGRHYHFDEAHGLQVSRLALDLFGQMQTLHRLGPRDRLLLLAAAWLHDIGAYISLKKHHKHSCYLISQSELPEFTQPETGMVAAIARYHRKNTPQSKHPEYARLPPADRRRVSKLAALLRLADALDHDHRQTVDRVLVRTDGKGIELQLTGGLPGAWEQWAVQKKSQWFREIFRRRVTVAAGPKRGRGA